MRALQIAGSRLAALPAAARPQVSALSVSLARGVASAKRRNPTAVATSAEAARNQAKPLDSGAAPPRQASGRSGRMALDDEGLHDPRRAAEEFAAEFANSSSSEEVVGAYALSRLPRAHAIKRRNYRDSLAYVVFTAAAERGPDPYNLQQGAEPDSHDAGHFHDEASITADRIRRDFGREPSSHARPRGGADAIPSESAMPSAAQDRSPSRGARKNG